MKSKTLLVLAILLSATLVRAQTDASVIEPILTEQLQSPQVVTYQLQQFLMGKVPALPVPSSAEQWTAEAQRIRRHLLDDVVFHGWPQEWVNSPPRFEDLGSVPAGKGYQLHRLLYEIVPGFYCTALLYTPEPLQGRVPAVLNVMGHFERGNKMEFEQKFCINQALKGMIALNPDWVGMGELNQKLNEHWFASQLDLVGLNGVGLFYLAMRRGIDYLSQNPNVDTNRIGVTGLSGGGWQTITISSLDPRVEVSIPVAGYVNLQGRLERLPGEPGDIEQNPTDFLVGQDYSTLTAMRAPRPTLLIDNAEDSCCFRAPLVKPYIFDPIVRFFKLYGEEEAFQFYQSTSISVHNYGLEERLQAYAFFVKHFNLTAGSAEIPVGEDVKAYNELQGGIPEDNLTIVGLARKMAGKLQRPPAPPNQPERAEWSSSQRATLREVVRFHPVTVSHTFLLANTNHNQVESVSYRFEMSNGLGATGVWLKETPTTNHAPLTIVLNDGGKKGASSEVWGRVPEFGERMERGEQVLVADLLFTGDDAPSIPTPIVWDATWNQYRYLVGAKVELQGTSYLFSEMLAAVGERPLGMEAAQLISLARWAQNQWAPSRIRLESTGIRSQVISLVTAALDPHLFSEVAIHDGMHSLSYLLEKPVTYQEAPDLFCLDLYKDFDLDSLAAAAEPTTVINDSYLELKAENR
jgi:dienelactone hydrolase